MFGVCAYARDLLESFSRTIDTSAADFKCSCCRLWGVLPEHYANSSTACHPHDLDLLRLVRECLVEPYKQALERASVYQQRLAWLESLQRAEGSTAVQSYERSRTRMACVLSQVDASFGHALDEHTATSAHWFAFTEAGRYYPESCCCCTLRARESNARLVRRASQWRKIIGCIRPGYTSILSAHGKSPTT